MKLIFLINIISSIFYIYNKNIILPFKRVSFEKFTGINSIDNYINYDIYTDIYMGTPPQKVTHFIKPHESVFLFKKEGILYNIKKFNSSITRIEKDFLSLYYSDKSSSYHSSSSFSDNFTFSILNSKKTVQIKDLKFTIFLNNRKEKEKYGSIGLFTMANTGTLFSDWHSFINQLKYRKIIDEKVFSVIYENNDIFDKSAKLGTIVIGEYSHQYNEKLEMKDEIKIYSNSPTQWSILIKLYPLFHSEAKFSCL